MTDLPRPLAQLRNDVGTVLNAIAEYERICLRHAWTGVDASEKQDRAYRTIETRMLAACDRIGILPSEKRMYLEIIDAARAEIARLEHTIKHLTERVAA